MKAIFTSSLLLIALSLFAQNPLNNTSKGIKPLVAKNEHINQTYALVVGISDYQDEGIPDLRFADKDAEAFAGFLQSPSGGSLDEDHLKVLLNEQATVAQFAMTLDWLWEVVEEDDRVIIYFSGHGDVEKKSITQPGYLLCWDAPARVYMAGGAFNVRDLNDVITTLSVQNKAKVILVIDACRAGKLSGSSIGGSQATAANLSKQYANEIKILSCQPDEYSIEGEQWGGGRGAFSYHLLDGLYGLADGNGDLDINLKEISRYLEDRVSEEVAPHAQNPMTVGSRTEKLTNVLPEMLTILTEGKQGQLQQFAATESKGIEELVLAAADTNIIKTYLAFKESLSQGNFLEPKDACADYYYEILSMESQLKKLHSTMRRNYAAALQDDAQQAMNIMLKSGLTKFVLNATKNADTYYNYPSYLEKASMLLGEQHYMYNILQARKLFFEGLILEEYKDKLSAFRKALFWQPDMAHAMVYMIRYFEPEQLDSAMYYTQKAAEIVPSWVEPYIAMSSFYKYNLKQPDKSEEMLQIAGEIDSSSVIVWYKKGVFYKVEKRYELAEKWYLKTINGISEDICFPCAYSGLSDIYIATRRYDDAEKTIYRFIELDSTQSDGYSSMGALYYTTKRYVEAEHYLKKAIQIDSTKTYPYHYLGLVYKELKRYEEAEQYFKKSIQIDSTKVNAYDVLGRMYEELNRYEEAEHCFKISIQIDSTKRYPYDNLGRIYKGLKRYEEAEYYFKKSIQVDSTKTYPYDLLGHMYKEIFRSEEAEHYLKKSIQIDSTKTYPYGLLGHMYKKLKRYEEAEHYLKKYIQIDSTQTYPLRVLGNVYISIKQYDNAELLFKKSILLDSTRTYPYTSLANIYFDTNQYEKAEKNYRKTIQLDPEYINGYYSLACLKSMNNEIKESFEFLETSILKGYNNFDWLQKDTDLENLRKLSSQWLELMNKHFPDEVKN